MLSKILRKNKRREEEMNYWISFSDLMASILIIFMLLFIYKILDYQEGIEKKEEIINELTSTRLTIISMLQKEFEKENIKITMDPKTGAIQLDEAILFDTGNSVLKEDGKAFLQKLIPVYLRILIGNESIRGQVSQIIVEGHTDDVGGYIYNLELSQQRAFSVIKFLLDDSINYEHKEDLKGFITANGRSFSNPIYDENNNIERQKSRRVEIKFRLNEEETLLKIKKELEEGKQK